MPSPQTRFPNAGRLQSPQIEAEESHEEKLLNRYLILRGQAREKEFVSTTLAAEMAGVTQRTIIRWINEGKVFGIRIGKKRQIYVGSLQSYLQEASDEC